MVYARGTDVLQHPNHNGVQIFWSFTTLKNSIQLLRMLDNKSMLHLQSNHRIESYAEGRLVPTSGDA